MTQRPDTSSAMKPWSASYPVRADDTDMHNRLSPRSLAAMLLDAAGQHAAGMGVSIGDLQRERYTWVLSRLSIRLTGNPRWTDQITVTTWPTGFERLLAFRDFRITGAGGAPIGGAYSSWLVIDTETRRPVRVAPFLDHLVSALDKTTEAHNPPKLPALSSSMAEQRFRVRKRDIDLNRHVTSVSYIDWVMESVPDEYTAQDRLAALDINYLAETFAGETVLVRSGDLEDGATDLGMKEGHVVLHTITRENDATELARARTVWISCREE